MSTRTIREALITSVDSCAEIKTTRVVTEKEGWWWWWRGVGGGDIAADALE